MVKATINGYEFKFEKRMVDTFENLTCESFELYAPVCLLPAFEEDSLEEVFKKHDLQEIKEKIIFVITEEIAMYGGEK